MGKSAVYDDCDISNAFDLIVYHDNPIAVSTSIDWHLTTPRVRLNRHQSRRGFLEVWDEGEIYQVQCGKVSFTLKRFIASERRSSDVRCHQDSPGADANQHPAPRDILTQRSEHVALAQPVKEIVGVASAEMNGITGQKRLQSTWVIVLIKSEIDGQSHAQPGIVDPSCLIVVLPIRPYAGRDVTHCRVGSAEQGHQLLIDLIGFWLNLVAV